MSQSRVTVIQGAINSNILLVAPHGPDDTLTGELTTFLADNLKCHAVINNGFKRADDVDSIKDMANCNSLAHCQDEVVWEEFLKPILTFETQFKDYDNRNFFIFYIHGVGAQVDADIILGIGLGLNRNSFTMKEWRACFLYDHLTVRHNLTTKFGKAGGKYSARSRDNLTQLYRTLVTKKQVESVQIEVNNKYRQNVKDTEVLSLLLADTIKEVASIESYNTPQKEYLVI